MHNLMRKEIKSIKYHFISVKQIYYRIKGNNYDFFMQLANIIEKFKKIYLCSFTSTKQISFLATLAG